MARKAKNKVKYWRRATETIMIPKEYETTNDAGEVVKQVMEVPHVLKGRSLRNYRAYGGNMKPMASVLMINLISRGGYDIMDVSDEDTLIDTLAEAT
jgi:hypothetical protein